jgi:hypothetical protein
MDTSFCLDALEDALRKGGRRSSTPIDAKGIDETMQNAASPGLVGDFTEGIDETI